jgi:hypothetical protein
MWSNCYSQWHVIYRSANKIQLNRKGLATFTALPASQVFKRRQQLWRKNAQPSDIKVKHWLQKYVCLSLTSLQYHLPDVSKLTTKRNELKPSSCALVHCMLEKGMVSYRKKTQECLLLNANNPTSSWHNNIILYLELTNLHLFTRTL